MLLAAGLPLVWAQSGTITANGQPVPGATVRATQGERALVTLTGENGAFRFTGMTPGAWVVETDMFGFEAQRREIQIAADNPTKIDFSLQLGARAVAPPQLTSRAGAAPANGRGGNGGRGGNP